MYCRRTLLAHVETVIKKDEFFVHCVKDEDDAIFIAYAPVFCLSV